MGEYRVEIATSSRIFATSDYVANLHKQCATFFALYRTLNQVVLVMSLVTALLESIDCWKCERFLEMQESGSHGFSYSLLLSTTTVYDI